MKRNRLVVFCAFFWATGFVAAAQPFTSRQIDSVVALSMKTFDVPGIAVAVVKDGQVIHEKGYGVRSLHTGQKVDEHTSFGIASNTKAFTTAALGILVEEGKINWDDRVTRYIPEFKLYAPYVTGNFTIRDLLTHRSGLGLGAGDLMVWPDSSTFTVKDVIHNLRFLPQVSGFRTKYDYDNLLYIVAGEVVARVSGMSWEDFVQAHILDPLQMTESAPNFLRLKNRTNVIDPHAIVNGSVQVIHRDWKYMADAAGGIYSSVHDMGKWVLMQMSQGKYGPAGQQQLFRESIHQEMWRPQTIMPVNNGGAYDTHFAAYGLGWNLRDESGYKVISHPGALAGVVTQVTIIPELNLGIIVFTNQQTDEAYLAITNAIKDSYYGRKGNDWVHQYHTALVSEENAEKKISDSLWTAIEAAQKNNTSRVNNRLFIGTYADPWLGKVVIAARDGKMWLEVKNSPRLNGEMFHYKENTYIVKWSDRSMDADAYVIFHRGAQGKPDAMKMKAISPLTDFSFDFQDLDFKRVR